MDEGCAYLIGILIVIALIIAFVVYIVLPLTVIVVGGIAAAGTVTGAAVAGKNFKEVLVEAHKRIP